ncbi:urea carboxylase-associated family protein [Reyranella sp. CPCC 100927]|uniref:urea carboxylase-associated family protein n=1 Tax=Reyranella sp. CPCC 100927 TaxID=2599616 RepID=UPI0011B82234|nr:urea carboxylase-associated family protein [Reyranella sp. CPCC 100927]TWT13806.1 urea carboxylase-associated family protein [Reyranella sp. CPCC 100927]
MIAAVTLKASVLGQVGQRLRLKNTVAGPADVVTWVYDRIADDVILQFSAPATLVAQR